VIDKYLETHISQRTSSLGYITLTAHFIDVGWKFENFGTGMATHEVHSSFIQHHEICKLVLRNHFKFFARLCKKNWSCSEMK
jgi:hypothetical protein